MSGNESDDVTLWFGTGAGGFVDQQTLQAGDGPHDVEAADLDNDGLLDLAVAHEGDGTVWLYLNTGCLPLAE